MFNIHTMRRKIMLAGAVLLSVILIQAFMLYSSVNETKQGLDELTSVHFKKYSLSRDLQFSIAQVQGWLTDISATRGKDGLDDGYTVAEEHAQLIRGYLSELAEVSPQHSAHLKMIGKSFEVYYQEGIRMARAYVSEGPDGGNKMMSSFDAAAEKLQGEFAPILKQVNADLGVNISKGQENVQGMQNINLIVNILILGFMVLAFFIVNHSIKKVDELGKAVWNIAEGDGDLTQTIDASGQDEVAHVADGFNRFISSIRDMVIAISENSNKLAANAETSTEIMEQTSRGVVAQKDDTLQVATAVTEISAIGAQTADKAEQASQSADQAQRAAQSGRISVDEVVSSINGLASEIQAASQVIEHLHKKSDEIGNILNVIKGIAEQTNLLALNAAIEAARAGEQGRGFAVVADEVRTLATRTQESTSEIQATIEQLQQGAREAISSIASSSDVAGKTVEKAGEAKNQLHIIVDDIETINTVSSEIAHSTAEQNKMVSSVHNNIEQISKVADQTAEGAQQTASASRDLLQLSQQLTDIVRRFKV